MAVTRSAVGRGGRRCVQCDTIKTTLWRQAPHGAGTMCDTCYALLRQPPSKRQLKQPLAARTVPTTAPTAAAVAAAAVAAGAAPHAPARRRAAAGVLRTLDENSRNGSPAAVSPKRWRRKRGLGARAG